MQCISNRIFIFDDVYNDVADDDNGGPLVVVLMMIMTAGRSFGSGVNCRANKKGEMTAVAPHTKILY